MLEYNFKLYKLERIQKAEVDIKSLLTDHLPKQVWCNEVSLFCYTVVRLVIGLKQKVSFKVSQFFSLIYKTGRILTIVVDIFWVVFKRNQKNGVFITYIVVNEMP